MDDRINPSIPGLTRHRTNHFPSIFARLLKAIGQRFFAYEKSFADKIFDAGHLRITF